MSGSPSSPYFSATQKRNLIFLTVPQMTGSNNTFLGVERKGACQKNKIYLDFADLPEVRIFV